MRVKSVCVCVCVCVPLLLLNRYLDFDGNCRKLTVIIRSNYSAYFDVPVRWEVPGGGGTLFERVRIPITINVASMIKVP